MASYDTLFSIDDQKSLPLGSIYLGIGGKEEMMAILQK